MSSKCDAPIEKKSKLPEDVFLETLKIVRAQNSFFAILGQIISDLHETNFMFFSMKIRFFTICLRLF